MNTMPTVVLSIRQPWAFLIVTGQKGIENRAWGTSFRGSVWMHTGKAWGRTEKEDRLLVMERFRLAIPLDLPLGGIVGQAEVVDCVTPSPPPWFMGAFAFVLEHAQPVAFKACPGRLAFLPATTVACRQTRRWRPARAVQATGPAPHRSDRNQPRPFRRAGEG